MGSETSPASDPDEEYVPLWGRKRLLQYGVGNVSFTVLQLLTEIIIPSLLTEIIIPSLTEINIPSAWVYK